MKHAFGIIFMMLIGSSVLIAQSSTDKRANYGFNFGLNYSNLRIEDVPNITPIQENKPGFRLGIVMDYRVTEHFHFSPKAELAFNNSSLVTPINNDGTFFLSTPIFPVSLELMTHAVFMAGKGSFRPYVLIGPNYKANVKDRTQSTALFSHRNDLAADIGIGFEKRFTHFTIAPEIRYSKGLFDVNLNPALKSVHYNNFVFAVNFKG
jgi:hypothetical protein